MLVTNSGNFSPSAAGFFSGKVTKDAVNQKGSRWDSQV
jgi:hypothetical protein